jgi:hypothetical protein
MITIPRVRVPSSLTKRKTDVTENEVRRKSRLTEPALSRQGVSTTSNSTMLVPSPEGREGSSEPEQKLKTKTTKTTKAVICDVTELSTDASRIDAVHTPGTITPSSAAPEPIASDEPAGSVASISHDTLVSRLARLMGWELSPEPARNALFRIRASPAPSAFPRVARACEDPPSAEHSTTSNTNTSSLPHLSPQVGRKVHAETKQNPEARPKLTPEMRSQAPAQRPEAVARPQANADEPTRTQLEQQLAEALRAARDAQARADALTATGLETRNLLAEKQAELDQAIQKLADVRSTSGAAANAMAAQLADRQEALAGTEVELKKALQENVCMRERLAAVQRAMR